ncbi:MAG: L-histidine N(alpha)-methyltransferase [Gammaproteobacteria bacterium]
MSVSLLDLEPASHNDEQEIIEGLARDQKEVSPKYFYDEAGSQLFEEICEQPEYYPTRTELGIMREHIEEIATLIGPNASIIEFGSGASVKTRLLLEHAPELAAYVPVDISRDHLASTAETLAREFPDIEVLPVCADFTQPFELPIPSRMPERNVVYFPGSTIGNFSTREAVDLMKVMRAEAKDDGALLIGVDLEKPRGIVERAYNDAAGVTADFNLNLLARLNREHEADFDLDAFEHAAVYDEEHRRIEMRLISLDAQSVQVAGETFEFDEGEYIVTEHSHKYSLERFASMAAEAEFEQEKYWTDPADLFSVQYLVAA